MIPTPYMLLKYDVREWPAPQCVMLDRVCSRLLDESGVTYGEVAHRWASTSDKNAIELRVESPSATWEKLVEILSEDAVTKCCERLVAEDQAVADERAARQAEAAKVIVEVDAMFAGMTIDEFAKTIVSDRDSWFHWHRRERAYAILAGR